MVNIIGVFNCDECGNSYLEDVGIDESQLINRGITLEAIKKSPNDFRVELKIPSCDKHNGMRKVD